MMGRVLALSLLPWLVVGWSLYVAQSAPLALCGYQLVCLLGGKILANGEYREGRNLCKPTALWGLCLAANAIAWALYLLLGNLLFNATELIGTLTRLGLPPSRLWFLALSLVVLNPLCEEYFWRGGIYRTLCTRLTERTALLLAACLFGAWHWLVIRLFVPPLWAIIGTLFVMGAGAGLTYVVQRTNRLREAVWIHAIAADLPVILIIWHLMQEGKP
jgi:membrane protease YdiL (CAAX protease family)